MSNNNLAERIGGINHKLLGYEKDGDRRGLLVAVEWQHPENLVAWITTWVPWDLLNIDEQMEHVMAFFDRTNINSVAEQSEN